MHIALQVLDELVAQGKESFEAKDVRVLTGASRQATTNLLTRLVQRGLLERVARGHYAVRPLGVLGTSAASEDITIAVAAAFGSQPHRIAYRSALDFHDLLDHPAREIVVALTKRTGITMLGKRSVRSVTESPSRIAIGSMSAGNNTRVSTLERALLESAARPSLAGGMSVVATAIATAKVDTHELVRLSALLGNRRGFQRIGSIAHALQVSPVAEELEPFSHGFASTKLDPSEDTDHGGGRWNDTVWNVEWSLTPAELDAVVRA